MRIAQIITDYIRGTALTTPGDLLIRGATAPERLEAGKQGFINHIPNGDMSDWRDGASVAPIGWVVNNATVTKSAVNQHSGKYVAAVGSDGINVTTVICTIHEALGIDYWKGKTVQLGFWVGTSNEDWVLQIADGVLSSTSIHVPNDGLYHFVTVKHTISPTASSLRIYCRNIDPLSTSTIWIDSAVLVEGSYCPPIDPPQLKTSLVDIGVKSNTLLFNASETQVVTDLGYMPSCIFIFAVGTDNTLHDWSVGFSNLIHQAALHSYNNGTDILIDTTNCINITHDASNSMKILISALSLDGFSMTSTLTGSCDTHLAYLALP